MKIVLTGSLGHISRSLAQELIQTRLPDGQEGHDITVISSNAERREAIEALGAKAAIGRLRDADFLTAVFTGADAVYCMTPMPHLFDPNIDVVAYYTGFAPVYLQAIRQSGVRRVVHLSSVGAHTDKGSGMLRYAYEIENTLRQLPAEISLTFMRPVGFYYNLLGFIPAIRQEGVITSNYGGADKKPWVSPVDIAMAVAEELTAAQPGTRKIRYVASDELSCDEIARMLGDAVGRPNLEWRVIADEEMLKGLLAAGMHPNTARDLVEMNAGMHSGKLYEDYYRNRPVFGKIKLADFAKDFAKAYHQN